jgi:predicted transcriptional regulator
MATKSRQRVTIDLRGTADRLSALATARHMTTAALVRVAIRQTLEGQVGVDSVPTPRARALVDRHAVKVTIRLAPEAAAKLAERARAADVSQGSYVTGLLDGAPPPIRSSDHGDAVAVLAKSTDALAGLRVDLNSTHSRGRSAWSPRMAWPGGEPISMR